MERSGNKIVPYEFDVALSDIQKLNSLVDGLLEIGEKIRNNEAQLEHLSEQLRRQELNNQFYTITEVADALHCKTKRAYELLREHNVPIIESGKSYVVNKKSFLNAFEM